MKPIGCPVCSTGLRLSPAKSRKAKKPKSFLMLVCPTDGRHFRGFISDKKFVSSVLQSAQELGQQADEDAGEQT